MSYILEALRRADAERQRGAIPGLHAQSAGSIGAAGLPLAEGAERESAHRRWLLRTLIAAAALLALVAAWWLGQGSARDAPAPALAPSTAVDSPLTAPPLARLQPPAAVFQPPAVAQDRPAVALLAPPLPAPAVGSLPSMPLTSATSATAATSATSATAATAATAAISASPSAQPVPTLAPAVSAAPAVAKAAAASAPEPLLAWAAMPEASRAGLPRLAWSGVVYAEQPAQRLVVVNGQVLREGDEIAPGLQLEQIRPRSAVLRWRGQRVEMPL